MRWIGGGTLRPPLKRRNGERARGVPAPARGEHRGRRAAPASARSSTVAARRNSKTISSGNECCSPSEMTMPLSVAAACSSKLNERQKRLRSARPQARLMRAPNGAWRTSCMPPPSSKKRSATTGVTVGTRSRAPPHRPARRRPPARRPAASSPHSREPACRPAPGTARTQLRELRADTARTARRCGPGLRRARRESRARRRGRPPRARARPPRAGSARRWCPAGRHRQPCSRPRSPRRACRRSCLRARRPPGIARSREWRRRR